MTTGARGIPAISSKPQAKVRRQVRMAAVVTAVNCTRRSSSSSEAKKRSISLEASGPRGSVKLPSGLPPDQA